MKPFKKHTFFIILLFLVSLISIGQELKLGLPLGHTHGIILSHYSPNGKLILTKSPTKVCLWETSTGKLLNIFPGSLLAFGSTQFSPNGKRILITSGDGKVSLWDLVSGKLLHIIIAQHDSFSEPAQFSPNGKRIVTLSDGKVSLWDSVSGELLHTLKEQSTYFKSAQFSPNGKRIVTASNDGKVHVWESKTGKLLHIRDFLSEQFDSDDKKEPLILLSNEIVRLSNTLSGKLLQAVSEYTQLVKFSPDGKKALISYTDDGSVSLIETETGKLLFNLEEYSVDIRSVQFSPNSKKIVIPSWDKPVRIWETSTGKLLNKLEGHTEIVYSAKFSPDGKKLVTVSKDKTVRIWEASTGKLLFILKGHTDTVNSIEFSPNGKTFITTSRDKTACLWETSTGKLLKLFRGHTYTVSSVKFNPNAKVFTTESWDGSIRSWNTVSGKYLYTLEGLKTYLKSAQFSPDGKRIVTISGDGKVSFWDPVSGKLLHTLKTQSAYIKSVQFSPDSNNIVTVSSDKIVCLWETSTGKLLNIFDGYTNGSARYSPDGKIIISASDDRVVNIWDAVSGKLLRTLEGHSRSVYSAEFSPKGLRIVTASRDDTVRIWDTDSGKLLQTLEDQIDFVESAHFSSDGKTIIVVSTTEAPSLWDSVSGKLLHTLTSEEHDDVLESVHMSPDNNKIVTAFYDNTAGIWETVSGKLLYTLNGHKASINSVHFSSDGKYIITGSHDGIEIIWDVLTGKKLIKKIIFDGDPKKWVHIHPSGLFDASPEAMELMYWTKGLEVIEFSQLKEKYYMPGLWEKVMKGEYLGNVDIKRDGIQLQPEVALGKIENNMLPITLTKREGGYGEVSVFLNGKEIIKDARPKNFNSNLKKQTINLDVSQFKHLTKNGENNFIVKVKNKSGDVQSRGTITKSNIKKEIKPPSFYGLFIGINDYVGDIDLKYPVPDVNAMYNALELGAQNLFGKDKTHLYKLTTDTKSKPRKEIIQQKLNEIAEKANPEDVLFIYLSGHGLTWTGTNNESDFYFLTEDARFANKQAYNDKDTREQTAISTNEWVEYIKKIAANKTVMVIDACGSGQAVENLIASRDIESNQIKAVDRMKDRTGMFVISGSAADRVSYEASKYGQGLLTYTLLKAMSGVALKENKNIDVSTLFNYAKDQVPFLAKDIGGIQEPQVLFPKSGSFDLGILNTQDQSKIQIKEPKDVYVRSTLINADELEDNLDLSSLLDEQLNNSTSKTRGKEIIWVDAKKYANGCKISGSYSQETNQISLNFKVKCKDSQTKHKVSGTTKEEVIKLILEKL